MAPTQTAADHAATTSFRDHLPDLASPRFVQSKQQDIYQYVEAFRQHRHPRALFDLTETWKELLQQPFQGVTEDGQVRPGLFGLSDGGLDVENVVSAISKLKQSLSEQESARLKFPLSAREWRCWSNPEFYLRPLGLRLDELQEHQAKLVLAIVEASFSPEGYRKALGAMRTNHFLGELCEVPQIMNQYSYNILLFGEPSSEDAFGWSLYGHHLCLNVFIKGSFISVSPTFTGAEPNVIDQGQFAGTRILDGEGELGLQLMQSLSQRDQNEACIFKQLKDPQMLQTGDLKIDRWNIDDQRHLCGAFRDNRIIPREGISVANFNASQKQQLLDIVEQFVLYLPAPARDQRLAQVRQHLDDTHFCWIGESGQHAAFYFRIQSPVIICEFDHHSGVFLTNEQPARFHIHTLVRTPNGGDYGNALRDARDKLL